EEASQVLAPAVADSRCHSLDLTEAFEGLTAKDMETLLQIVYALRSPNPEPLSKPCEFPVSETHCLILCAELTRDLLVSVLCAAEFFMIESVIAVLLPLLSDESSQQHEIAEPIAGNL